MNRERQQLRVILATPFKSQANSILTSMSPSWAGLLAASWFVETNSQHSIYKVHLVVGRLNSKWT